MELFNIKAFKILITFIVLVSIITTKANAQTIDPNNPGANPSPQTLLEAGITQVRVVLKDPATDGGATLAAVQAYQAAGINVVGIVNWEYGSNGAWPQNGPGSQNTSEYINNFVNNVIPAMNQTYGNLHAVQVWNEPDDANPAYVNSVKIMSPENYATLLGLAHAQLSTYSQFTVSAGLVSGNASYLQTMLANGATADAFAIHPYVVNPNPNDPASIQQVIDLINFVNGATGTPVWITEFGWETSDQAAQAAWLLQVYQLQQSMGILDSVMWYGFSDVQNPGFGLIDSSGAPKLAFLALIEYLKGNPISNEQLQLLLANNFVKCNTLSGEFMGFALTEAQCALYKPCTDEMGNIIGYAFGQNLCKFQQEVRLACGGQLDMEPIPYRPEVVGHNLSKPFSLATAFNQEIDSTDEDKLVNTLSTTLWIEGKYEHPDFRQPAGQLYGSIKPDSPHYVANRMSWEKLNMPTFTMWPANHYGLVKNSYGISSQPDWEFEKGESATDYIKRIYKTSVQKNETVLGIKSEMETVRFNACIQRVGCSAAVSGPEGCIKKDSTGLQPVYCTEDDNPDQCVSAGRLFSFNGKMIYEEPTDGQVISRGGQNFMYDSLVKLNSTTENIVPWKTRYQYIADIGDTTKNLANKQNTTLANNSDIIYAKPGQKKSQSVYTSLTTPEKANAQSLDEDLNNGTYQTTTPQNCQNMTALIENKGTSYAIKAWDTQPLSCPYLFDYSLTVTYYINGAPVGGCHHDLIPQSAMPKWGESNPNTNNGAWGLPVSDLGAGGDTAGVAGLDCSVPVVPTAGETLTVDIQITGNAPDNNPGCGGKTAFCSTGNLKIDTNRPEAVDCRVCPAWAPPSMCAKILSKDIAIDDQCLDGNCQAGGVLLEDKSPIEIGTEYFFNTTNLIAGFGQWLVNTLGFSSTECDYEKGTAYDGNGNPLPDPVNTGLDCRFNAHQYSIYVYPSRPLIGDFSQRSKNMSVNDALFNVKGYTSKYFDPEAAKAPVNLKLSIKDRKATDGDGNSAFDPGEIHDDVVNPDPALLDTTNEYFYLGFTEENDNNRTMYLDYPLFRQPQASGYCLSQIFLAMKESEDKLVPKSTAESGLCDFDFMPGSMAYKQEQIAKDLSKHGISLAQINRIHFDTPQIEKEIATNVIENDHTKLIQDEIEYYGNNSSSSKPIANLTDKQRNTLREEFIRDLEIIIQKYNLKSLDKKSMSNEAIAEMNQIKAKFEKKLGA
jgi:hypothetical protein